MDDAEGGCGKHPLAEPMIIHTKSGASYVVRERKGYPTNLIMRRIGTLVGDHSTFEASADEYPPPIGVRWNLRIMSGSMRGRNVTTSVVLEITPQTAALALTQDTVSQ